MKKYVIVTTVLSWFLGLSVVILGLMNLILVHPVPGFVFIFLSLPFFPPVEKFIKRKFNFSLPFPVLLILAVVIFWFTLGISDLGEMYGF